MDNIQAVILGVVQGITEFLPISSSGHLILVPEILGWPDQGLAFDAIVHLGTLAAIIIYFWQDVLGMIKGVAGIEKYKSYRKLALMIIVGTLPVAFAGYYWGNSIEILLRNPGVVVVSLIIWAIMLLIADIWSSTLKKQVNHSTKLTWSQVIFIGFAQAIALIPGTSRSGITITAGMLQKLNRQTAARFSFLLGLPAIFAAGILKFYQFIQADQAISYLPIIIGLFTSFIAGLFAIWFLMKLIQKRGYWPFVIYRIALALVVIVFVL